MYYLYYLTFTPICNNILHQEVVLHEQVLSRIYMYYLFRLCARCFLSKYFLLEFIFSSCSSQELLCKVLYDITTFEWRYSSGLKGQGKFGQTKACLHTIYYFQIPIVNIVGNSQMFEILHRQLSIYYIHQVKSTVTRSVTKLS